MKSVFALVTTWWLLSTFCQAAVASKATTTDPWIAPPNTTRTYLHRLAARPPAPFHTSIPGTDIRMTIGNYGEEFDYEGSSFLEAYNKFLLWLIRETRARREDHIVPPRSAEFPTGPHWDAPPGLLGFGATIIVHPGRAVTARMISEIMATVEEFMERFGPPFEITFTARTSLDRPVGYGACRILRGGSVVGVRWGEVGAKKGM